MVWLSYGFTTYFSSACRGICRSLCTKHVQVIHVSPRLQRQDRHRPRTIKPSGSCYRRTIIGVSWSNTTTLPPPPLLLPSLDCYDVSLLLLQWLGFWCRIRCSSEQLKLYVLLQGVQVPGALLIPHCKKCSDIICSAFVSFRGPPANCELRRNSVSRVGLRRVSSHTAVAVRGGCSALWGVQLWDSDDLST